MDIPVGMARRARWCSVSAVANYEQISPEPPRLCRNGESTATGQNGAGLPEDSPARHCIHLLGRPSYIFPAVSSASRTSASVKLGDLEYFWMTVRYAAIASVFFPASRYARPASIR